MSYTKRKSCFTTDTEASDVENELLAMVGDETFNTESGYSSNDTLYPDNVMPFVDKHMAYLRSRSGIDPQQYLSNLRLMTRKR